MQTPHEEELCHICEMPLDAPGKPYCSAAHNAPAARMAPLPIEKNVDEEMRTLIRAGGLPFARLQELKAEDPEHWVSPECSLEMYAHIEHWAIYAASMV